MKPSLSALSALLAAVTLGAPALAQSAGDFTLGFGLALVSPKDDNGTLAGGTATVGDNARPSITAEYFIRDNLGIELLGALPFKHGINISGIGYAGETKHLPPTVTLNWHFPTGGAIKPFLGLGVNYTVFFEEKSPLGDLQIDESFGLAGHLGFDYALNDSRALRMDLRYIDIDSDVKLNGAKIGKVEIDPLVFGVSYIMKF